ncbi:MAG: hypothetical protein NTV43_15050 [Methylococcales bacterium]|nr:hypothetical protein [Methylococcales bacterium]
MADLTGQPQALDRLCGQLAVQHFRAVSVDGIQRPAQGVIVKMPGPDTLTSTPLRVTPH